MLFEPWLGNFNPTDQQKNEYIRRLKEALTDIDVNLDATLGIDLIEYEVGSYVGSGSGTKVISLSNTAATPALVALVGIKSPDNIFAVSFTSMVNASGRAWIFSDLSGTQSTAVTTSRVSAFSTGSFTVAGTSGNGLNQSTFLYYWFALSSYTVD